MTFALRILQVGAIAVVLAASTLFSFELDRFFIPKELVLHAVTLLAGLAAFRRITFMRVDLYLAIFLGLSVVSAALATNRWLGMRALAISASGLMLFWVARALQRAGHARPLLGTLAFAVVLVAVTSLLQTYGVETTLFSENRAPGGTLGNRNFVAHAAAFGMPLLLFMAFSARGFGAFVFSSAGVAITTATLVLTRSRAAWLAFAAVILVTLVAIVLSGPLRRDGRTWRRVFALLLLCGVGVAAALLIPNALRWRDDNPYLESVRRVADYEGGSGRGRLIQYQHSVQMAARHPLFGVGPGNWAVEYPDHAARHDPSINDSEPGTTFNPWPSSDWVAYIAERGFAAFLVLAIAFFTLAWGALRNVTRALDVEEALRNAALLGVVAGAAITGLFDAVMLLALPAFLVWTALGALAPAPFSPDVLEPVPAPLPEGRRVPLLVLTVLLLTALGAARSTAQLVAMQMYETGSQLSRAARIDPGNYRLRLRLARAARRAERCGHARAAHALYPHAEAGKTAARRCE